MSKRRSNNRGLLETLLLHTDFFLISLLCVISVCVVIHVFFTIYTNWNADFAGWQHLSYAMLKSHALVPKSWYYGTETFLYFPIPMALLMLFVHNQLLIHSIGALVVVVMCVFSLYLMSKYVFCDRAFFLFVSAITLAGFIGEVFFLLMLGELTYTVRFTQIITVVSLFAAAADVNLRLSNLRTIKSLLFIVVFILLTVQSLTVIQQYVFPLVAALSILFIKEYFYDEDFARSKPFKSLINTVSILVTLLLISVVGNQLLFANAKFQSVNYTFVDGELLLKNIQTIIINFSLEIFDVQPWVRLFSLEGLVNLFKIVFGIMINFVFPALLIKRMADLDKKIQLFVLFVLTYVVTNIILTTCAFGAFSVGQTRYFMVSQLLVFILSGYFVNEFIVKKSLMGKCMVYAVLLVAVCAYNIPRLRRIDYARESIQTQRALTEYLLENNLRYGYSQYWNAANNMTLSNYEVIIAPVSLEPRLVKFTWLSFDDFYDPARHNGETFLLLIDEEAAQYPPEQLVYGTPSRVLYHDRYVIYVYDYNLSQNNFAGKS